MYGERIDVISQVHQTCRWLERLYNLNIPCDALSVPSRQWRLSTSLLTTLLPFLSCYLVWCRNKGLVNGSFLQWRVLWPHQHSSSRSTHPIWILTWSLESTIGTTPHNVQRQNPNCSILLQSNLADLWNVHVADWIQSPLHMPTLPTYSSIPDCRIFSKKYLLPISSWNSNLDASFGL